VQLIRAATPIWRLTIILTAILGAILLLGGIELALFGNTATTNFTLFGNQFSSTSVGVSIAFMGVVLVAVVVRRILTSLDRITTGEQKGDSERKV
jgi:hypothetical protein